jgi:hypothetical protein
VELATEPSICRFNFVAAVGVKAIYRRDLVDVNDTITLAGWCGMTMFTGTLAKANLFVLPINRANNTLNS